MNLFTLIIQWLLGPRVDRGKCLACTETILVLAFHTSVQ